MEGVCHSQVQPEVCSGRGYVIVRYNQQCVVEGVCHSQVQPAVCSGRGYVIVRYSQQCVVDGGMS